MKCLACQETDARTECGALLCHDCEEDEAQPVSRTPVQDEIFEVLTGT